MSVSGGPIAADINQGMLRSRITPKTSILLLDSGLTTRVRFRLSEAQFRHFRPLVHLREQRSRIDVLE